MSVSWLDRGESDSSRTFSTTFSLCLERTGDGEVRMVRTVLVSGFQSLIVDWGLTLRLSLDLSTERDYLIDLLFCQSLLDDDHISLTNR